MNRDEQRRLAAHFLALHEAPEILVLPNAWDAVSARLYELEGFAAIGTTSAGISASLGFPDGERMSLEDNLEVVRRIVRVVEVPVSADVEAGYAATPEDVVPAAEAVIETGAVGLNIEDGGQDPGAPLVDAALHADKIRAVCEAAERAGVPLVVNARTDVYLHGKGSPPELLQETLRRAALYREAGADCIFVPDFENLDETTIATLAAEIASPLNLIAGERTPPLHTLEALGVARVSFGPRPMRAALALLRSIAREWRETGCYTRMCGESLSYDEVNGMFERSARE